MATISRRSLELLRSTAVTLATADDLDGTTDNSQAYDVTGAKKVLIMQIANGTAGTAGIDVIEVSHDGGVNWAADDTVLPVAQNDTTGTIQTAGALNAAGVEPTTVLGGTFTAGPWDGPTAIRCGRKTTDTSGTTWVTGAPTVSMVVFGGSHNGGAPSTTLR